MKIVFWLTSRLPSLLKYDDNILACLLLVESSTVHSIILVLKIKPCIIYPYCKKYYKSTRQIFYNAPNLQSLLQNVGDSCSQKLEKIPHDSYNAPTYNFINQNRSKLINRQLIPKLSSPPKLGDIISEKMKVS